MATNGRRQGTDDTSVDPRIQRSRAAVLEATVALLAELGWAGTTVEAVAERSGVAKTTIYRHWRSRDQLVLDALDGLLTPPAIEATGDLYADLVTMACALADALEQSAWSRVLPAVTEGAERNQQLATRIAELTGVVRVSFTRRLGAARDAGTLPAGADLGLMTHLLIDPLFVRRLLTRERSTTRFIEALVDGVLRSFSS
ncbi:MAG TPA: TetR/AcrR family transcriptional regulator [Acidimicrobiia bacterium]|nr:TetR/AcrR family transcriptional regulator [Acidimicrobiia bacterium]